MFKSLGADLAGTSDNCTPIRRDDVQGAGDIFSFLLPTDIVWIILKSKVKEFIFTDVALVFIERDNVTSPKRLVKRYPYFEHKITNVRFETPGKIYI
jgi:hypothetical protein